MTLIEDKIRKKKPKVVTKLPTNVNKTITAISAATLPSADPG
jgi:hypothetical protein